MSQIFLIMPFTLCIYVCMKKQRLNFKIPKHVNIAELKFLTKLFDHIYHVIKF